MENWAKKELKKMPYIRAYGSATEGERDAMAHEGRRIYNDGDAVLGSMSFPDTLVGVMCINYYTALVENHGSSTKQDTWHDLLDNSKAHESWGEWEMLSDLMRGLV